MDVHIALAVEDDNSALQSRSGIACFRPISAPPAACSSTVLLTFQRDPERAVLNSGAGCLALGIDMELNGGSPRGRKARL